MLILNKQLWKRDGIIKVRSSSIDQWEKQDSTLITNCVLNEIKELLEEAVSEDRKMMLLIDLSKGCFPPWLQALKMAGFFVSIKALLTEGLDFTLIYAVTEQQKTWIGRILTLYTPARPVHIVENKEEIHDMLRKRSA